MTREWLKVVGGRYGLPLLVIVIVACAWRGRAFPKVELVEQFPGLTTNLIVSMAEAPDESRRFFIAEQDGRILLARAANGSSNATEFLSLVHRQPHASYEQGLLGMAFHPGFRTNGLIYVHYNQQNPRRSIISEFKTCPTNADAADISSERVVLEVPQPADVHKGGQIAFGPDGFLYIGLGDGGGQSDPSNNAQNTATLLGKILRIDVNTRSSTKNGAKEIALPYGIPEDNPFVSEPELPDGPIRKEIWAYGLRNPWRFSWDRETGELWAGDVGQDNWEEIDLIVKGGNYGWCLREGTHRFKPGPDGAQYVDPVIEYPHDPRRLADSKFPRHSNGMCVVGGYVYRGRKVPALQGTYLYADFALGKICGLRYEDGKVTDYGTMLEQPKNITSFAEDLAGELYVLTSDGHIFSLVVPGPK
jgi:glucose/arabinose dehydrogenase